MQLSDIIIVLVEPTHPGNIGSVARAMKTMGLSSLVLINPKKFPHYEASKLAAGADSVLESAVIADTVEEVVSDATLVLGTSVRDREVTWPTKNPREVASAVFDHASINANAKVAILFGRESSGLSNEELDLCQFQVRIDANSEYSSLNLASAVQIMSYELRMRFLVDEDELKLGVPDVEGNKVCGSNKTAELRQKAATRSQLDGHMKHLQSTLEALDFIKVSPPTILMRKIARLYNKADLSVEEIQILRGILSAMQEELKKNTTRK